MNVSGCFGGINVHVIQVAGRRRDGRPDRHAGYCAGGILFQACTAGLRRRGKSGAYGWIVSNGSKRFFCRLNVSLAYVNKKEMVSLTSSGRIVKLDRATFEASIGGHDPSIPQWSDLQAGHLKPADVGSCAPVR